MSDPVLAMTLLVTLALAISAARWFRSLESGLTAEAARTVVAGLACGGVVEMSGLSGVAEAFLIALLTVVCAVYLRHVGRESEPAEGMLDGALLGTAVALPQAFGTGEILLGAASSILAGAVSGYGITSATFHVREKARQLGCDALTAAAAAMVSLLPLVIDRTAGVPPRIIALVTAAAIPLTAIGSVFVQSTRVRGELEEESGLGFVDPDDVARTAHPFRRFGRGDWIDAAAYREFVRTGWKIALRKRQQRSRPEAVARLYQLEIIKLRMHLQEMRRVGRGTGLDETAGDDVRSDKMRA